jgi:hypothetical protein
VPGARTGSQSSSGFAGSQAGGESARSAISKGVATPRTAVASCLSWAGVADRRIPRAAEAGSRSSSMTASNPPVSPATSQAAPGRPGTAMATRATSWAPATGLGTWAENSWTRSTVSRAAMVVWGSQVSTTWMRTVGWRGLSAGAGAWMPATASSPGRGTGFPSASASTSPRLAEARKLGPGSVGTESGKTRPGPTTSFWSSGSTIRSSSPP